MAAATAAIAASISASLGPVMPRSKSTDESCNHGICLSVPFRSMLVIENIMKQQQLGTEAT